MRKFNMHAHSLFSVASLPGNRLLARALFLIENYQAE